MKPDAPWVVIDAQAQPAVAKCLCCGEIQNLPLPMRVSIFTAIARAMTRDHYDCASVFERLAFAAR
jgi:hypothetical protein